MYCKYCGQIIDDDSTFCRYCGKNIVGGKDILPEIPSNRIHSNRLSSVFDKINKESIISKMKSFMILLWKILRTIFWVILAIITHLIVGFIMAPLFALFNADYPELGFSERIGAIWKKNKADIDQNTSTSSQN